MIVEMEERRSNIQGGKEETVLTAFEELRGGILWTMNQRPDDCVLLENLFSIADRKLQQARGVTPQGVIEVKDQL